MKNKKSNLQFIALILALLLPAMSCNFPQDGKSAISVESLRQTLEAAAPAGPAALQPSPISPAALPGEFVPPPSGPVADQPGNTYITQPGDTLDALAKRFKIDPAKVNTPIQVPPNEFLPAGETLSLPVSPQDYPQAGFLLPDAEAIDSPAAAGFDISQAIDQPGGYLSHYEEYVDGVRLSGAEIVQRVAVEASVNPRLLLAFLDFRSGWVSGQPKDLSQIGNPIGFFVPNRSGLYQELVMAATHLNLGYYGWRSGSLDFIKYNNGSKSGINPWLNPGSVGLQNLFAKFYSPQEWQEALYGPNGFINFYTQEYGDPRSRAAAAGPLFPPGITQPLFELPFQPGERWAFTGGPHFSWNTGSARGALDFAPVEGGWGCNSSTAWVTAATAGVVSRSANNVVAIDIDGDGNEQTGWVLVYLHIAEQDSIAPGSSVEVGTRLGHPSCERGSSTGLHIHIARKFNGEWLAADGPLPFVLSGWQVQAGKSNYQGVLTKGDQQVVANPGGPQTSIIIR